MSTYLFILGALGLWRVTHLLHAEDGPWSLSIKLRRLAGTSVFGQAMDCFYCLSLWLAVPFAAVIGLDWLERVLLWPALSAAAIVVETLLTRLKPQSAPYFEDEPEQERSDVQLREPTP